MVNLKPEEYVSVIENRQSNPSTLFKPYAQSPLHNFNLSEQARQEDDSCGIWLNEIPLLGYIVLRGDSADPQFNSAVHDVIKVTPPITPHTTTSFPEGKILWQSPDEWLIVCARQQRELIQHALEQKLSHLHAQVTDNSGGLTMVRASGKNHVDLLRHLGPYDFESIKPGQAISTICHKVNIIAMRNDEDAILIVFRRSFADYFWRLLTKAAKPYGIGISKVENIYPDRH